MHLTQTRKSPFDQGKVSRRLLNIPTSRDLDHRLEEEADRELLAKLVERDVPGAQRIRFTLDEFLAR